MAIYIYNRPRCLYILMWIYVTAWPQTWGQIHLNVFEIQMLLYINIYLKVKTHMLTALLCIYLLCRDNWFNDKQ